MVIKGKKLSKFIFMVLFLGLIFSAFNFMVFNQENSLSHNPISKITNGIIIIDGNDDFSSFSGDGTFGNPYIISDLIINTAGTAGINISNTNVFFIIENVIVSGSTNSVTGGFHFNNVTNGILIDNLAMDNNFGFSLQQSSNFTFTNNIAMDNSYGFILTISDFNTFNNNTAINHSGSGYETVVSHNNTFNYNIARNNTDRGFEISLSSFNNTLNTNFAEENGKSGFHLYNSLYNTLQNNTALNN
ncbi:MAG: right-handed parallel beta-helix repeat-containing protein, partial [Candidatus Hodarchaeales archaeon]